MKGSPGELEAEFHDAWRRMVLGRLPEAREQFAGLMGRLETTHAKYAGKVLTIFFHPYVMGPEQERRTVEATEPLTALLEKVARLYHSDEAVRSRFDFDPRVRELILAAPAPHRAAPVLRFDSFVTDKEIRFVEANTDGSSGMNDTNVVEEHFLECELAREIARTYRLTSMRMHQPLLEAILECYSNDPPNLPGPPARNPVIGIVDWKGVNTETEFFGLKEYFDAAGYPTVIVDPREVTFDGERLRAGGTAIDIVYKRVLTAELLSRWNEVQPLIEGYRRGAYTQVGPYLGEVIYDKSVLAFLSDPESAGWLTPAERELVARHVPWTRLVRPGPTEYEGDRHELVELLRSRRERFVIKPSNAYGGLGVKIGKETPPADWDTAIETALGGHHIAQEIVPIPEEELILVGEGRAAPKKVNIGQFMFSGKLAGLYCRVSNATVINVSAGGATLPCFKIRSSQ